jgi:hypothetical protein
MAKTYPELSFAEKAIYHVRKAEEWQIRAEALEKIAGDRAADDELAALRLTRDKDLAFPYKQATGNRNGHQQRAIMYSLIALLERQYKE